MVAHSFSPSTQEAEAGGLCVPLWSHAIFAAKAESRSFFLKESGFCLSLANRAQLRKCCCWEALLNSVLLCLEFLPKLSRFYVGVVASCWRHLHTHMCVFTHKHICIPIQTRIQWFASILQSNNQLYWVLPGTYRKASGKADRIFKRREEKIFSYDFCAGLQSQLFMKLKKEDQGIRGSRPSS